MINIKNYETMVKIALTESERVKASDSMNILMKSFDELKDVDAQGIDPLITVLDIKNVMRDDVTDKLITKDELLSNASEQYEGYFQVPKTLD